MISQPLFEPLHLRNFDGELDYIINLPISGAKGEPYLTLLDSRVTDLGNFAVDPSTSAEIEMLEKRDIDERRQSGYKTGGKVA